MKEKNENRDNYDLIAKLNGCQKAEDLKGPFH
jgi:hypothetical protein